MKTLLATATTLIEVAAKPSVLREQAINVPGGTEELPTAACHSQFEKKKIITLPTCRDVEFAPISMLVMVFMASSWYKERKFRFCKQCPSHNYMNTGFY